MARHTCQFVCRSLDAASISDGRAKKRVLKSTADPAHPTRLEVLSVRLPRLEHSHWTYNRVTVHLPGSFRDELPLQRYRRLDLRFRQVTQRLFQVIPNILDGLDTHAQSQQSRRQVLLPRNTGSPFDGRFHRAQASGVLNESKCAAYGVSGRSVTSRIERDNCAEAL